MAVAVLAYSSLTDAAGDSGRGAAVFNGTCIACHGSDGAGNLPGVPDLTERSGLLSQDDAVLLKRMAYRAGTVSVVSVKEGKVETTYKIGKRLHGLDIGDDGKTLFVSSRSDDKLVALDTTTGAQRSLTLSPEPYHLDRIPGTGKVYVSSSKAPIIWVIDQKTFTVIGTIQLPGGEGHQIAVVP